MGDGNNSKSLDADYLAAIRDTDLYKDMFQTAYQNPELAIERVGKYRGAMGMFHGTAFETERSAEPPYETNYSKAAQQLRQYLVRDGPEENNPRDFPKYAKFKLVSRLKDQQAVTQLALTEALEAHEQQGKRFVHDKYPGGFPDIYITDVITGYPKSTRSMGQTVDPLQGTREQKNTTDKTLMENMRKK